jgi:hypothetical protein
MWLALTSIVLASAIGFNVLALWLTAWFERRQPKSPSYIEQNANADIRRFFVKFDSQIVPIRPKDVRRFVYFAFMEKRPLPEGAEKCVS